MQLKMLTWCKVGPSIRISVCEDEQADSEDEQADSEDEQADSGQGIFLCAGLTSSEPRLCALFHLAVAI
jgi:hypothetical protein